MTFNKPRVVIPGIGKQKPVGLVKPNARKRMAMNEPQELSKAQEDALVDIATDVMTKLQADVMAVMKPAVQTICDVVQSKPEAVQIVARHVQLCAIGALAVALDRDIPDKQKCLEMLDEIEGVVVKYCKAKGSGNGEIS